MKHPTNDHFEMKPGSVYIDTEGYAGEMLVCTVIMFASVATTLKPDLDKGYCMIGLATGCLWENDLEYDQERYEIWDDELAVALKQEAARDLR